MQPAGSIAAPATQARWATEASELQHEGRRRVWPPPGSRFRDWHLVMSLEAPSCDTLHRRHTRGTGGRLAYSRETPSAPSPRGLDYHWGLPHRRDEAGG